jgi:hypothetical protein
MLEQMAEQAKASAKRALIIMSPMHVPGRGPEEDAVAQDKEKGGIFLDIADRLRVPSSRTKLLTDFGTSPFRPKGAGAADIWQLSRKPRAEDDEDDDVQVKNELAPPARSLHAKGYLLRTEGASHFYWGSANLSRRALSKAVTEGGNVELLVSQRLSRGLDPLSDHKLFVRVRPEEFKAPPKQKFADQTGPEVIASRLTLGPRRLVLTFSKPYRGLLKLWTDDGQEVEVRSNGQTCEVRGPELSRLGLDACGQEGALLPRYLHYAFPGREERWIEISVPEDLSNGPDEPAQERGLEDMMFGLLGVRRTHRKAGGTGGPGGGSDPADEDGDDEVGFTEHEGELCRFFRLWRLIFRELKRMRPCEDLYASHFQAAVKLIGQRPPPDGRLAFLLSFLTRPEMLPVEREARTAVKDLCKGLLDRLGPESALGIVAKGWLRRISAETGAADEI